MVRRQLLDPLVHHLRVAQLTEPPEQFAWHSPQLLPRWIGINLLEHRRHRPAAPDRHAKIVHRAGVRRFPDVFQFLEYPLHPMRKAPVFGGLPREGGDRSHTVLDDVRRCQLIAAPAEQFYRVVPGRSRVQPSARGPRSGIIRRSTTAISNVIAAASKKT